MKPTMLRIQALERDVSEWERRKRQWRDEGAHAVLVDGLSAAWQNGECPDDWVARVCQDPGVFSMVLKAAITAPGEHRCNDGHVSLLQTPFGLLNVSALLAMRPERKAA